jgi:primosomal protein N' (replication factor Y)
MKLVQVLIQYVTHSLDRTFTYLYDGQKSIDIGYRVLVNFANRKCIAFVCQISNTSKTKLQLEKDTGYSLNYIIDVLDDGPLLNNELMTLADEISSYYLAPKISVLQTMLPTSLKPSLSALKAPKIAYDQFVIIKNYDETNLTAKQIELLRLIKNNNKVSKKEIKSPSIINKLLSLGLIEIIKEERLRYVISLSNKIQKDIVLTNEQISAINNILNTAKQVTLLEGVTGSGKTEIYLKVSEEILKQGKNVLMLVPEISLTPAIVQDFYNRFKEKVAVLHSGLTPAEKYDEYRKIARGETRIVVGARSAIFAPLDNIGLIILDEEHVESYKQDAVPFYHAREVAFMRAKHFNCKVLLGSATPSLESRARAMKGVYNYVLLPNRINGLSSPKTKIIDLLNNANLSHISPLFSNYLIDKINITLNENHQIIILLNHRGYSSYISCRSCGYIFKCPNCGVSLTYHREDNMLKCHHCGHVELMPKECPECHSTYISKIGFGTERIMDDLHKLFPSVRILRLDSDVSKVRSTMQKSLNDFREHKADILVGTQMVAKGHDFNNVTLVAVLLADIGLSLPSFRSSERTFQLISQAIGRSGRGDYPGEAVIQTYMPHHYAIELASKQDYESFFKQEMHFRKLAQYPPYTYVTSLDLSSKNENFLNKTCDKIALELTTIKDNGFSFLGPVAPYIRKEGDQYHLTFLLKYKKYENIKSYLLSLIKKINNKSSIHLTIDIDTYNF